MKSDVHQKQILSEDSVTSMSSVGWRLVVWGFLLLAEWRLLVGIPTVTARKR